MGGLIGAIKTAADAVKEDGWDALKSGQTWAKIGVSAACGAINGLAAASGIGIVGSGIVGAATGFVESLGHELIDNSGNMADVAWNEVGVSTLAGAIGGLVGGRGAINGNKYMANQQARLLKHTISDGISKAHSFAWKMTANYSKQFVVPTLKGLAKGTVGERVSNYLLNY